MFPPRIGHVFSVSAQKQMVRVNTRAIIATGTIVTNLQAIGDCSEVQCPREDMGTDYLPEGSASAEMAIPGRMFCSNPYPTPGCWTFCNLFPEAFLGGSSALRLCPALVDATTFRRANNTPREHAGVSYDDRSATDSTGCLSGVEDRNTLAPALRSWPTISNASARVSAVKTPMTKHRWVLDDNWPAARQARIRRGALGEGGTLGLHLWVTSRGVTGRAVQAAPSHNFTMGQAA